MAAVCWRCIKDEHLKKKIQEDGTPEECSLCGRSDENAFGPDQLAELLDPLMREHFAPGQELRTFGEDDSEGWEQEGSPLSDHLHAVIGQYLDFEDEIVDALEVNEDVRPQDGDVAFFDRSQNYVDVPVSPYRYVELWNHVLDELKHRRRFFSGSAKTFYEDLFAGVENRESDTSDGDKEKVVWEFPAGSELFRARTCSSAAAVKEVFSDPFKNAGPPPPERTRSGRMNPEGVAVFYGSLDCETCIAETRPALGDDTAVIKVLTTRAIRLLDFGRLGKTYTLLSYFQPDFIEQLEKGAFLRRLQRLISQPIVPGRETDYIITQTMAEYLAHVHVQPFDGILFGSVQRTEGTNIVLFPNLEGMFPLSYVDNSVALYTTEAIKYAHRRVDVHQMGDGELWIDRYYEEDEW